MKNTNLNILILFILIISLLVPGLTASAQSDDVIGEYLVDITPQSDGTLIMKYQFENYCATTDFPTNSDYLEVGVPNRNFEILEYGPSNWIKSVKQMTSGGSWVHLDFLGHPVAGDCFDFYFVIKQSAMAYPAGENITFEFSQGTFSFAKINHLQITWHLPSDSALVVSLTPQPEIIDNAAVWDAINLAPDKEYGITVIFAKAAFPDFQVAQPPQNEAPQSTDGGSSSDISGFLIFIMFVIVIIVVILVITYISVASDNSNTYTGPLIGGGNTGGYRNTGNTHHSPPSYTPPSRPQSYRPSSSPSPFSRPSSSPPRSSGLGSGAGRSSSCACACVNRCACACASGGGRAGCTQKYGYFIARLLKLGHKA